MTTNVTRYAAPPCTRCYIDSIHRAARAQSDPLVREIMLRAAHARLAREGPIAVSPEVHARHTRRDRPWPSERAA